jgi:hypothetical protein
LSCSRWFGSIEAQSANNLCNSVEKRQSRKRKVTNRPLRVKAVRIASLVIAAFLAASVALALAGCAAPYVERPSAEVILVPVA